MQVASVAVFQELVPVVAYVTLSLVPPPQFNSGSNPLQAMSVLVHDVAGEPPPSRAPVPLLPKGQ